MYSPFDRFEYNVESLIILSFTLYLRFLVLSKLSSTLFFIIIINPNGGRPYSHLIPLSAVRRDSYDTLYDSRSIGSCVNTSLDDYFSLRTWCPRVIVNNQSQTRPNQLRLSFNGRELQIIGAKGSRRALSLVAKRPEADWKIWGSLYRTETFTRRWEIRAFYSHFSHMVELYLRLGNPFSSSWSQHGLLSVIHPFISVCS